MSHDFPTVQEVVRATGILDIKIAEGIVGASYKRFQLIQRNDGFDYATHE